jgi:NADH/F420H2 dehydrogenase subunit C
MDILQIKPEEELLRTLPFLVVKQENDNFIGITHRKNVVSTLRFLRDSTLDQYKILSAISVVDYPERQDRFEVVYELLSLLNNRFRLKTFVCEKTCLQSIVNLHSCADWWEREAWDLFGVFFKNHPDLRRILTDYGFEGHPLRKDFPCCGYVDLRYDENAKRVVMESLGLDQSFRVFNYKL